MLWCTTRLRCRIEQSNWRAPMIQLLLKTIKTSKMCWNWTISSATENINQVIQANFLEWTESFSRSKVSVNSKDLFIYSILSRKDKTNQIIVWRYIFLKFTNYNFFKCGIVHYISFSESKINILHVKIKTQSLRCRIQVMYGVENKTKHTNKQTIQVKNRATLAVIFSA